MTNEPAIGGERGEGTRDIPMIEMAWWEAFCEALNNHMPGWSITENGIAGPGGVLVRLGRRHLAENPGHIDVQFCFNSRKSDISLWDCVAGAGDTVDQRAKSAAYVWSTTTGCAILELLYSRQGKFAEHFHGADPIGFRGWHVIGGPSVVFGHESSKLLQEWITTYPILPALSRALSPSLDERTCPHGVKIIFGGGDVAEVRVDSEVHECASAALAELPWPRVKPFEFVRRYLLVLHREDEAGINGQHVDATERTLDRFVRLVRSRIRMFS
jgi:hypothetical protein